MTIIWLHGLKLEHFTIHSQLDIPYYLPVNDCSSLARWKACVDGMFNFFFLNRSEPAVYPCVLNLIQVCKCVCWLCLPVPLLWEKTWISNENSPAVLTSPLISVVLARFAQICWLWVTNPRCIHHISLHRPLSRSLLDTISFMIGYVGEKKTMIIFYFCMACAAMSLPLLMYPDL